VDAKTDASFDLHASRYALVSRLADDLAHEIKNPLHSMVINLEVLRRRVAAGDTEIALERAAVIDEEIQRTHRLVDLLLKLIRPERDDEHHARSLTGALEEVLPLIALQAKLGRVPFRHDDVDVDAPVGVSHGALKFALLTVTTPILEQLRAAPDGPERGGLAITATHAAEVRIEIRAPRAAMPDGAALECARAFLHGSGARLEAAPDASAIYLLLPRFTGA
jgi:signal transduction histidine kinase